MYGRSWVQANRRIILRGKIDNHYIQIHDRSISWLDKDTSIKSGEVKLVLWAQTSSLSGMMRKGEKKDEKDDIVGTQRPIKLLLLYVHHPWVISIERRHFGLFRK